MSDVYLIVGTVGVDSAGSTRLVAKYITSESAVPEALTDTQRIAEAQGLKNLTSFPSGGSTGTVRNLENHHAYKLGAVARHIHYGEDREGNPKETQVLTLFPEWDDSGSKPFGQFSAGRYYLNTQDDIDKTVQALGIKSLDDLPLYQNPMDKKDAPKTERPNPNVEKVSYHWYVESPIVFTIEKATNKDGEIRNYFRQWGVVDGVQPPRGM